MMTNEMRSRFRVINLVLFMFASVMVSSCGGGGGGGSSSTQTVVPDADPTGYYDISGTGSVDDGNGGTVAVNQLEAMVDNNKILIVDYKTDDIDIKKINDRAETYLTQLKFYSYIVSRLFKNFSAIELKLIFIKHPDNVICEFMNQTEIVNFSIEIKEMISMMRKQTFTKNLAHCRKCLFVFDHNRCIKD